MIQQYLKIQAPKEQVMQEFVAISQWPEWWPGVKSINIHKDEPTLSVVELELAITMTINMTLELDRSLEDTIRFKQLKGWFKSYKGEWKFLPGQDGSGTTLKCTMEMTAGAFVPKAMVYAKFGDSLKLLETKLNQRLSEKGVRPAPAPIADPTKDQQAGKPEEFVHLFPTKKGLELWIAGKPYLAKALLSDRFS